MGKNKKIQLFRKMRNNIIVLSCFVLIVGLCTFILRKTLWENTNQMGLTLVENYTSSEESNIRTCEAILDICVNYIGEREKEDISIEEEVLMTVSDFNIQQGLVATAVEALELAETAYSQTKQRFIIGKIDLNTLTLSLNRQQDANKNYISALQNYWLSYYKLRKLTLFDFDSNIELSSKFDIENRVR